MLSPELLNELKQILKEDYGIELNQSELVEFSKLVAVFDIFAKVEFETLNQ